MSIDIKELRPYYTMLCFTSVFDSNMLISKTRVKVREKREKNVRKLPNMRKTQEHFSILHFVLGKNASLLRFLAFLLTNLIKVQPQRIEYMGFIFFTNTVSKKIDRSFVTLCPCYR